MRILFYAPFKPLGHPNPSGDLIIGSGIYDFLTKQGHEITIASTLRARWIYLRPLQYFRTLRERKKILQKLSVEKSLPDIWLTYHCYYKAPDLIGPYVCRRLGIPYVIFQGIYSTKRKRDWKTKPGFYLNKRALLTAKKIFSNRREDYLNLQRLLPDTRLSYIAPGIYPNQFNFDPTARAKMRKQWHVGSLPVILSAAMFRQDVKTEGLIFLLKSCGRLLQQGYDFPLVIAGDGREKNRLKELGKKLLGERIRFVGKLKRHKMYQFYSSGDMFVFPGIRESLGMVYLEAQSCGLPVIAFENGGIPEVVKNEITGKLTKPYDQDEFDQAIIDLLTNEKKRKDMGSKAQHSIRKDHDLDKNYRQLEHSLLKIQETL